MDEHAVVKIFAVCALAALAGCARREAQQSAAPEAAPEAAQAASAAKAVFELASADFAAGALMPAALSCDGANLSPQLSWSGAPEGTKGYALVLRDPDAPSGHFLHWAVTGLPASASSLARGARPPSPARELANDAGTGGYFGPCPPSGTHRYIFTLYALDSASAGSGPDIEGSLAPHTLAKTSLTGLYKREK
mgnify:CR=1 FL=1